MHTNHVPRLDQGIQEYDGHLQFDRALGPSVKPRGVGMNVKPRGVGMKKRNKQSEGHC